MSEDNEEGDAGWQRMVVALKSLSEAADEKSVSPSIRERAAGLMEKYLVVLKNLRDDPDTSPEVRADIDRILRSFLDA